MSDSITDFNNQPRILLVAFHSYAGMGPYVVSIVNSFKPEDNISFFLIERDDHYYTHNIKDELKNKATIVYSPIPNKIETLYSLLTGFKCKFIKQIARKCINEQISIVHDLTGTSDYKMVKDIGSICHWMYTVHDLHPHEARKSFFKLWRQNKIYAGVFKAIKSCSALITNSNSQYRELIDKYPDKQCFKTPFPSLITKSIENGGLFTPEIKGINKYILFFGRIEEYKGLSVLIEAFKNIQQDTKLVIAGKGELPYNLDDKRIIFINRYINDREIANLYMNSLCVVYPYLSATQSGVLAIASYFNIPIIASDVPFFKEILGESYKGLFKTGDSKDLALKLISTINLDEKSFIDWKKQMEKLYNLTYEGQKQREMLLSTYKSMCLNHR